MTETLTFIATPSRTKSASAAMSLSVDADAFAEFESLLYRVGNRVCKSSQETQPPSVACVRIAVRLGVLYGCNGSSRVPDVRA